ncbi:MAG: MaoC family dehydratase [Deltaproteobacteria bacterium]|nr:MaoC family dehydratase [Deltaproteobacteria bacterium]
MPHENALMARLFADIEIGDEIGPLTYAPTLDEIRRYAAVVRMVDQRFISKEIAQQRGFEQPIVPGPLSATVLSRMLREHLPGWRLQTFNISFRAPVRHGDVLSCLGIVTQKEELDGVTIVHCDVLAENQNGDRALVGTATLAPRVAPGR